MAVMICDVTTGPIPEVFPVSYSNAEDKQYDQRTKIENNKFLIYLTLKSKRIEQSERTAALYVSESHGPVYGPG